MTRIRCFVLKCKFNEKQNCKKKFIIISSDDIKCMGYFNKEEKTWKTY